MTEPKIIEQKYLGRKGLIALLALLNSFVPMTTDVYLPALPKMAENFNAAPAIINLTLIAFFIFYAIGTLIFGPLSDKFGRKPILIAGLLAYILSSALCALAFNVYQLIFWRIIQAMGSGAVTAAALAIIKDAYEEKERASVLAIVQSIGVLAPVIAPIIGAFILTFTDWRGVFWSLTIIGLISLAGVISMKETITERTAGNFLQSLGRLGVVLKNPGFAFLLLTFCLFPIAMMAYVSGSSYIYINQFGLSEQVYSFYFACNAAVSVFGPLIYVKASKKFSDNTIIISCYGITIASGLLLLLLGNVRPWLFLLALLPSTLSFGILRPPSTNLMFEQQQHDTGSVSSLINFTFTVMACIGMLIISFNWTNRIIVLGLLYIVMAAISLAFWLHISRKPYLKQTGFYS